MFQEPVHIKGSPANPEHAVSVNGVVLDCDRTFETIAVYVGSFLAFNLQHIKSQETSLETFDGLAGIRREFSLNAAKKLLRAMNIV